MATSAEPIRALRERERRGLRRFTIGMSADDLRVIAEHGYEGAASADQDQQHVGSREGKRKWREAAGFGHEPTQRASVLSHSPMMRACRSRSFGQSVGSNSWTTSSLSMPSASLELFQQPIPAIPPRSCINRIPANKYFA
jgi:hypothetical protein